MNKPKVILIAGPTGVGKTSASVHLAKKLDTHIISCDSMQIYKGMDIGTAKVTPFEAQGVVHYMTDIADPKCNFSVCDYVSMATPLIYEISKKQRTALVVGGTGLYADSLIKGIEYKKDAVADKNYREEMLELCKKEGPGYIHKLLKEVDSESADNIHPNNVKRVIRALEYHYVTGEKISSHNEHTKQTESPFESIRFYFVRDRENLYKRIDTRVDIMIKDGLIDEVKSLLNSGVTRDTTAMQALGYKEIADAIEGKYSFDDAVELIKKGSRHYAKRQITWFKRDPEGIWLNLDDYNTPEEVADKCYTLIEERNML